MHNENSEPSNTAKTTPVDQATASMSTERTNEEIEKPLSDLAIFFILLIFFSVLGFLFWIHFICEDCYKTIIEPLLGLAY